jgi:cytochrome P450
LAREHIRGTMILLMIAGIDTTWSAIGAALWHLAQHPDDRHRLASEPGARSGARLCG